MWLTPRWWYSQLNTKEEAKVLLNKIWVHTDKQYNKYLWKNVSTKYCFIYKTYIYISIWFELIHYDRALNYIIKNQACSIKPLQGEISFKVLKCLIQLTRDTNRPLVPQYIQKCRHFCLLKIKEWIDIACLVKDMIKPPFSSHWFQLQSFMQYRCFP